MEEKVLHAGIEDGRVTERRLLHPLNVVCSDVTEFKEVGNVMLVRFMQLVKADIKVVTEFMVEGKVMLDSNLQLLNVLLNEVIEVWADKSIVFKEIHPPKVPDILPTFNVLGIVILDNLRHCEKVVLRLKRGPAVDGNFTLVKLLHPLNVLCSDDKPGHVVGNIHLTRLYEFWKALFNPVLVKFMLDGNSIDLNW